MQNERTIAKLIVDLVGHNKQREKSGTMKCSLSQKKEVCSEMLPLDLVDGKPRTEPRKIMVGGREQVLCTRW